MYLILFHDDDDAYLNPFFVFFVFVFFYRVVVFVRVYLCVAYGKYLFWFLKVLFTFSAHAEVLCHTPINKSARRCTQKSILRWS